jgi:hypothetical protein
MPTLVATLMLVATTNMHPEGAADTAKVGATNLQVAMPKANHPDFYSPQSVWTRKLGQIECSPSLLRVCFDGSKALTHFQVIQFSEITRAIWSLSSDKDELRMEE